MTTLQDVGAALTYQRAHEAQIRPTKATPDCDFGPGRQPIHGRHWQLARYELPVKEVEVEVKGRRVVDIIVGDHEKLAYVHKWTGRRVEFTRPRLENWPPYLEEAQAKWECELAIAEANKRQKPSCIVGHITLPRTNKQIVADWNEKAKDPNWVKWPTKLQTAGAFGRKGPA